MRNSLIKLALGLTLCGVVFGQGGVSQYPLGASGPAGGDLSGTYPNPTVAKINGTALSGLATGLLKNTTATGVPSIAVAGTDLIGGVANLTTVGAVPYVSATGTLNQDPTAFFWDATNNRLGVGTATPAHALDVLGYVNTTDVAASQYHTTYGTGVINNFGAGNFLAFQSAGAEKMRISSTGNVGIGTTTSAAPLTVGTAVGSPATNANAVIINAANTTLSSRGGNLQVITTDSSAVDVGGSIGLGGQYNTLANSVEFASIAGRKENSTVTNFAGYLQFITTADAVAPTEKMRITSAGNVGIGITTPGYKLEVLGSSNTEIARVGDGTRSFGISTYTPNSGGVTLKNAGTGLISLTTANAVLIGTSYAGLGTGVSANTVAIEGSVGIGTTAPGVKLDVLGSARVYSSTADAAILLGSDQVDANSGKISYNRGTANLDITPRSTYATNLVGKLKFSITNSTGANSALLGANSPATILSAPYTWITVITSDGTTGYMPIWK